MLQRCFQRLRSGRAGDKMAFELPIRLFVFGAAECAGPQELPLCGAAMRRLRDAAYTHVTVQVIDGANHGYETKETELFTVIRDWLALRQK
jgi:hypothetical protein